MMTDTLHVVHARAAGLDVHKMQITASVRLCAPGAGEPQVETRTFEALASGLDAMVAWLRERSVDAAVMEGTDIYWLAPFEALEAAGIRATLVNARQVKQLKGRKTDVADSVWLARVCQFGLATPSHVPPKAFRELRVWSCPALVFPLLGLWLFAPWSPRLSATLLHGGPLVVRMARDPSTRSGRRTKPPQGMCRLPSLFRVS